MHVSPMALEIRVWDEAEKFRAGEYGCSQAGTIARKLVEGDENIKVVTLLLLEIHHDGRKALAQACPCEISRKRL